MSKRGFIYVLSNAYMADVYKIGCTERAPSERAAELSNHTGVPSPFRVMCYVEVEDFQRVEREIHSFLSTYRISPTREFFHMGLRSAVRFMWHLPGRLSFCDGTLERSGRSELLSDYLCLGGFYELADPWAPPPKPAPEPEVTVISEASGPVELKLVANGQPATAWDDVPF